MSKHNIISQPANILIVDDDPAVVRLLAHMLEHAGHRVRTATDGNTALQYTLQDCPEVLITDWMMPGINGLELCRRIRQLYECKVLKQYTYIFLLTAQIGKENLREGLNAGADDFIEKNTSNFTDLKIEFSVRLKTALRTRNMQRELEYAAKYDALTGLFNRSTFFEQGTELWTGTLAQGRPLAAVMVDCDYFKRINDLHGHKMGDIVLKTLASLFRAHSRGYDIICRYGGEEFCALLPGCNEEIATQWAERIRKQLEDKKIVYERKKINITASFGVAERKDDLMTFDQLIERADQTLLFAKESGRNRVVKYSDTLADHQNNVNSLHLIKHLFEGVTAADVMIPLILSIHKDETIVQVADFFLKTRLESLPVVNDRGKLIGLVAEKNLLSLVGDKERWQESIESLVTHSIITYTPETPLKIIYNFMTRVSMRRVLIVKDHRPIGYIGRNLLLRWLRNRWAATMPTYYEIIPVAMNSTKENEHIIDQLNCLTKKLVFLKNRLLNHLQEVEKSPSLYGEESQNTIVSLISQTQEIMEQILIANAVYDATSHEVRKEPLENLILTRGLF